MNKKITKALIEKAEAPAAGDAWLWDAEVEGFGVRIKPTGRKTFLMRYRNAQGVQRKITLGRCSDMLPETARDMARANFTQVAQGKDPAGERAAKAPAQSVTLQAMLQGYVAHMRSRNRSSAGEVGRALQVAAQALGPERHPAEVQAGEIVHFLAGYYSAGHRGAADKYRSYLASAYTWAARAAHDYTTAGRKDWGVASSPVAMVPKDAGAVGARDRALTAAEMRTVWHAAAPEAGGIGLETATCIRLLIACGQRVRETLRMEGADIDLEAREWRIPAHKTKGGKHAHLVPLPAAVLPTLERLVAKHGQGSLFPARSGAAGSAMDHRSIMQAVERLRAREGLAAFQARDLRRTWKTRAHDAGIDKFTRDLVQQHAQAEGASSKHYDRADYLPQIRTAMAQWGVWLEQHVASPLQQA